MEKKVQQSDSFFAVAIALLMFVIYFFSLPMTLTEGDAGEWALIAKYGGIPHPSGYPLYAILIRTSAWVFSLFPVITSVALISAMSAAVAAAVTYLGLVRLIPNRAAAAVAVIAIFSTEVVWRMATMPEPFALNILLASCVFLVFIRSLTGGFSKPLAAFFYMGLCFGLGFCNHHSLVWFLPFAIAIVIFASTITKKLAGLGAAVLGLILGLLPLVYFVFARHDVSPYDFYTVNSFHELFRLLMRSDYGSFQLTPHSRPSNSASLIYFLGHLPGWLSWIFAALVLLGFFILVWKSKTKDLLYRRLLICWSLVFTGCGIGFLLMFNVQIETIIPSIIERFMALPTYLLVVPLCFGLNEIYVWTSRLPRMRGLVTSMLLLVAGVHMSLQSKRADRSDASFFEDHTKLIYELDGMVSGALVSASDPEDFAVLYGRYILGLGEEKNSSLLLSHWGKSSYILKMVTRFHWSIGEAKSWSRTEVVGKLLEERGRVLVLDIPEDPKPSIFNHSYILGPAVVLVRPDTPLPNAEELIVLNETLFAKVRTLMPSCEKVAYFSSWDRTIYVKYHDGLINLKKSLNAWQRSDLEQRVDEILGQLCL